MKKHWFRKLIRGRIIVALFLLIQILFLIYAMLSGSMYSKALNYLFNIISLVVALHVATYDDMQSGYKLIWVFLILIFPIFGGLFYLFFHMQTTRVLISRKLAKIENKTRKFFLIPASSYKEALTEYPQYSTQIRYLQSFAGFPVYKNTKTKYLSPGEEKFVELVRQLKKAEKYIFLEYFIITQGIMWDTILDILKDKAKQGVDVRVIYDDMGCFLGLPKNYPSILEKQGIKCKVFNKFTPVLTTVQNNRDHRKIAVIDGKVAFTGGINLADEYINQKERFGHWKDSSVMLEGEAAWSFTVMFLQMWELCTNKAEDYMKLYPWDDEKCSCESDGIVIPYTDSPLDKENVGEHVYLQIINNAKNYIYINTPYLIIDDSLMEALTLASKSGVDVRIITPHHWDKRIVHFATRSYYLPLIKAGVRIYEYSSGFNHSKTFVSDDTTATVGTTNLDYRSLYLHFECGALMFDSSAVNEVKEDFLNTLEICEEMTEEKCKVGVFKGFLQQIVRLFAPLL